MAPGLRQWSSPIFSVKSLRGHGTAPGAAILGPLLQRAPRGLERPGRSSRPPVVLCKLTTLLLALALTHAHEYGHDQLDQTRCVPLMGHACRPPPCLFQSACRQVRGAPILALPGGDRPVLKTGRGLVRPTPPGLRSGGLRGRQQRWLAVLTSRAGGGPAGLVVKRSPLTLTGLAKGLSSYQLFPGIRGHDLRQLAPALPLGGHQVEARPHGAGSRYGP
jgi:hypothetical protein